MSERYKEEKNRKLVKKKRGKERDRDWSVKEVIDLNFSTNIT